MILISENDNELQEWQYEAYYHDYLLSLISTSTFEQRARDSIESDVNDIKNMNKETYDKIVFKLFNNQLDRITSGMPYSMTDIKKHLRKLK